MQTTTTGHVFKRVVLGLWGGLLALALSTLMTACESDGSSSSGNTVEGNVTAFAGSTAFIMPEESPSRLARTVNLLVDLVVSDARANVPGVVVTVVGTDIVRTTDGSGFFKLKDVPPGPQVLQFSYEGITGTLNITVPESGEVILTGIEVSSSGQVTVASVIILEDDDSSDDVSSDDDSSDDDSSDDESSDA